MAAEERVKKDEIVEENPNKNMVDTERCSASCNTLPTASSAATIPDSKWESNNQMVKIELDAARALADFATLALLESGQNNPSCCFGGESSSREWGHKGRRSKKRVKSEITTRGGGELGKNLESSSKLMYSSSDLVQQDHSIETQPWDKKVCNNVEIKTVKAEEDFELPVATHPFRRNFSGGRSKQHLTEAEKEARRIRRVLANRESARQTIRRRQAMCEALTKKACELALDNENMKREKELVMKQYQSLKDTNNQLKKKLARTEAEIVEAPRPIVKAPPLSEYLSLCDYKGPPFTIIWPSVTQPVCSVQTQSIGRHDTKMQDPVPPVSNPNAVQEQGNHASNSSFYILPSPWFVPVPDHGNSLHPPVDSGISRDRKEDNFPVKIHETGSSSNLGENVASQKPVFFRKLKADAFSSIEMGTTNNLLEASIRLTKCHPEELVFFPAPSRSAQAKTIIKSETDELQDSTFNTESASTSSSHVSSAPESMHEIDTYASKKLVDAATAAEARKRRKELTKMKNYQSRQVRLWC
ncbi:hypothetical protein MKW94_009109 [Papaver nudicaule]|uniref:BZIP domain-containing protein n=1 Tax=Papaver nudicaule TaxID=74823 RepID=A0AA42B1V8_PAPNU|nr:hypothetical protein [Papaver nudicaule]